MGTSTLSRLNMKNIKPKSNMRLKLTPSVEILVDLTGLKNEIVAIDAQDFNTLVNDSKVLNILKSTLKNNLQLHKTHKNKYYLIFQSYSMLDNLSEEDITLLKEFLKNEK